MHRVQFLGLSIRARLALIQLLLVVALATVLVVAWHACENERRSGSLLATLSQAERRNLEASELHHALRADIEKSLASTGDSAAVQAQSLASAHEHALALEVSLQELRDSGIPPTLNSRMDGVLAAATQNLLQARQVVALANRDRSAALAQLPNFAADSDRLTVAESESALWFKDQVSAAEQATFDDASRSETWIITTGIITAALSWGFVALIARSLRKSLRQVSETARALATGNFSARSQIQTGDEVGELAVSLNKMAIDLQGMVDRLLSEASRDAFGAQLTRALDMAESESHVREIVSRALVQVDPKLPSELLIAEANHSNLSRVSEHPEAGPAGCGVETLGGCTAIRRGGPVTFETSEALDACPRLRGRGAGAISATCVPITFMGTSFGVLHAMAADRKPLSLPRQAQLSTLGLHVGARIGTLRMLENTRVHAYTDGLTGLSNRRALEQFVESLAASERPYALAMADLDHFKRLNDLQGHEAGDRALKTFSEVVRKSVRQSDYVARWGGEEFAILFPDASALQAFERIEQLRARLAETLRISHHVPFTASFGIADSTMATSFEDVLRIADECLYESKDNGRDRATIANLQSDALLVKEILDAEHRAPRMQAS